MAIHNGRPGCVERNDDLDDTLIPRRTDALFWLPPVPCHLLSVRHGFPIFTCTVIYSRDRARTTYSKHLPNDGLKVIGRRRCVAVAHTYAFDSSAARLNCN